MRKIRTKRSLIVRVIVSTSFDEYCWLGSALSLPSIPVTKLAWKRYLDLGFVRIVH